MSPVVVLRGSYLALMAWPWPWLGPLTPGHGSHWWVLPLLITGVMALPLAGIWRQRQKALVWGGFLAVFAFMGGIMEGWTRVDARLPGLVYTGLALSYLLGLWLRQRELD